MSEESLPKRLTSPPTRSPGCGSTTPRSATCSTTTSGTRSRRRFPAWTGGSMVRDHHGTGRAFSAGYDIGAILADSFLGARRRGARGPSLSRRDGGGQRPPLSRGGRDQRPPPRRRPRARGPLRPARLRRRRQARHAPAKLGLIYGHTWLERFIDVLGVANTRDLFLTGCIDRRRAGARHRARGRRRGR